MAVNQFQIPERVRDKLASLPDKPGCYLMRDKRGKIIYVGKAISLRRRVQSYFRDSTWRRSDPKLRGLIHGVDDIDVIVLRNEAEALLTESRLIKEYKPRYNVDFRDDKRFLMLRINCHDAWPMFKAVRFSREDGATYLGPYTSSAATRTAMDFVEKKFGLRKCAPREPGPEDHRHCINDIVRFCSAPCIGRISRPDYLQRVGEACAFLRGERPAFLDAVRGAMREAGAAGRYEDAANLRDTWFMLRDIVEQRVRIRLPSSARAQVTQKAMSELQSALGMGTLPRCIECYDISNISGTLAVASMVCLLEGRPARARYRLFNIRTVEHSDDPGMMAEVICRRFQRLHDQGEIVPDLVVVDGGITQLRAAIGAIGSIGLKRMPMVIGLAKRLEEVHVPGRSDPIRLPADSGPLHLLQCARDEAHRFALQHHRRRRARRIRESVVDEIHGIGSVRKAQLLRWFGSVQRLKQATAEEIGAVPGIGRKTAESIAAVLHPLD